MASSSRTRRFVFVPDVWEGRGRAISCDGRVPGADLELSHWPGNTTPAPLKADTSTEIALNFVASPVAGEWADAVVVNNHYDTDGVLSVWTLLHPDLALARRDLLVAAAEAGDFECWPDDRRGLLVDLALCRLAESSTDDADAYQIALRELPALLDGIEGRDDLWGEAWLALRRADREVACDAVRVRRDGPVGVVIHPPGTPPVPGPVLDRHLRGCRGVLLAFAEGTPGAGPVTGRYAYRYERPRYSWADTPDRPRYEGPAPDRLAQRLGDAWTAKRVPGMTGLVRTTRPIRKPPAAVAADLEALDVAPARATPPPEPPPPRPGPPA